MIFFLKKYAFLSEINPIKFQIKKTNKTRKKLNYNEIKERPYNY